jgi:hypothetical protein
MNEKKFLPRFLEIVQKSRKPYIGEKIILNTTYCGIIAIRNRIQKKYA